MPALGHHSAAQFDTQSEIVLEGVVSKYDWRNPHVYMAIQMVDQNGQTYQQEIEAGASSILLPLGLTASSISIGDRVTVTAAPNRRGGRRIVLGRELVKDDGSVLPLNIASGSIRAQATALADSLVGTWFAPRPGFTALLGSRRSWELTERAKTAIEAADGQPGAHSECIPVTAPTLMVYPVITTIQIRNESVVFDIDWMKSRRVVYTDGRDHPPDGARTLHGHSVGHWEGNTLVVDTRLYSDHREGLTFGIPSGYRKHTVERFSLSSDRRHIDYEVFLEDPDYLAQPVTHRSQWEYRPDLQPTGLECELDVARRFLEDE